MTSWPTRSNLVATTWCIAGRYWTIWPIRGKPSATWPRRSGPGGWLLLEDSEHTVHRHLASTLRKLGLPSRAAAAAWGVRTGLM